MQDSFCISCAGSYGLSRKSRRRGTRLAKLGRTVVSFGEASRRSPRVCRSGSTSSFESILLLVELLLTIAMLSSNP
jgi:hypothetical protein